MSTQQWAMKAGKLLVPRPEYWDAKKAVLARLAAELDRIEVEHAAAKTSGENDVDGQ